MKTVRFPLGRGYILAAQASLFGQPDVIGFGDADYSVRRIDKDLADRLVIENHYSRKIYRASYIHLGVFMANRIAGVLQFGPAMNPASADGVVAGTALRDYLELNRMWLSDVAPRNSESQALSFAIKFIRRAQPSVQWIQSFADERCGRLGVVYQACNFLYLGEHTSTFYELDGVWYHKILMTRRTDLSPAEIHLQENRDRSIAHELRQFRYIFFLNQRARKRLRLRVQPYPKP